MPPKPQTQPSPLGKFILDNLHDRDMTVTAAAEGLGISRSYLSGIIYRKIPTTDILNKIADFFQTPRTYIYDLLGWIEIEDDSEFLNQIAELAKNDPDFVELLKIYAQCTTRDQRKKLIRIMRASIE